MQFIGFMVILVLTGILANGAMLSATDTDVLAFIATYSPWAAAHADVLGWVAAGIVLVAGLAIPPALLNKDAQDGGDRMADVGGIASLTAWTYCLLFLAIPSVGYLFGMGWFAARKIMGF